MNGPETLDELVAAIEARGWVFNLECGDVARPLTSPVRLRALSYVATIESGKGQVTWGGATPREALSIAFEQMDRMLYDGVTA